MDKVVLALESAKSQAKEIAEIIRKNHRIINPEIANKIENCVNYLPISFSANGNKKYKPFICGSSLCPVCHLFKLRKELALTAQMFHKISKNPFYIDHHYCFFTFTLKDCQISDVKDVINHLKTSFTNFNRRKQWKSNVVGWSQFFHFGLNPFGKVQPHIHVLGLVKPGHSLQLYELKETWSDLLSVDYLPEVSFQALLNQNVNEVMSTFAYGYNMIDHKSAIKEDSTYCELMKIIRLETSSEIRCRSHHGVFKKERLNINQEWKNKSIDEDEMTVIMKYSNDHYYQDRMIQSQFIETI